MSRHDYRSVKAFSAIRYCATQQFVSKCQLNRKRDPKGVAFSRLRAATLLCEASSFLPERLASLVIGLAAAHADVSQAAVIEPGQLVTPVDATPPQRQQLTRAVQEGRLRLLQTLRNQQTGSADRIDQMTGARIEMEAFEHDAHPTFPN